MLSLRCHSIDYEQHFAFIFHLHLLPAHVSDSEVTAGASSLNSVSDMHDQNEESQATPHVSFECNAYIVLHSIA